MWCTKGTSSPPCSPGTCRPANNTADWNPSKVNSPFRLQYRSNSCSTAASVISIFIPLSDCRNSSKVKVSPCPGLTTFHCRHSWLGPALVKFCNFWCSMGITFSSDTTSSRRPSSRTALSRLSCMTSTTGRSSPPRAPTPTAGTCMTASRKSWKESWLSPPLALKNRASASRSLNAIFMALNPARNSVRPRCRPRSGFISLH
mmetsp:Transcript_2408/g.5371  ORF Transcript_2408/g.5371 Transcript_2408/m.5371 type:complete len:202 (-) Transcript_2408:692-1297(-)